MLHRRWFRWAWLRVALCHWELRRRWRTGEPGCIVPVAVADRGTQVMDYVKPADVANAMVETGSRKPALPTADLLVRGILSGAILGIARTGGAPNRCGWGGRRRRRPRPNEDHR
jgi:hypothetical protein